jgi:ankyrin repeat protein
MARADVLDVFDSRGFTVALETDDAFLAACARGDEAAARSLVEPTTVARLQASRPGLFIDVAGSGNTVALRLMLDLGFDPAAARQEPSWLAGEAALHVCAGRGRLPNVHLLIERGAPLEARNARGRTPLEIAILCLGEQSEWTPNESTLPIAQALLDAGAAVDPAKMTLAAAVCLDRAADIARLAPTATPKDRQVALAAAAYNGLAQAIPTLLALGADPNAHNHGLHPDARPLHNAVCSGSLETVKALIEAGADPKSPDASYRATPLDWAEYFLKENRPAPKQDAAIVAYLRSR